jgi:hypothetical protein
MPRQRDYAFRIARFFSMRYAYRMTPPTPTAIPRTDLVVRIEFADGGAYTAPLSEVLTDRALVAIADAIRAAVARGEAWETPAGADPFIRITAA